MPKTMSQKISLETIVILINEKVFQNEGNSIWIKDNQYLMVYNLNVHQKFIKTKGKINRDFIKFDFIRKFFSITLKVCSKFGHWKLGAIKLGQR